VKVSPVTARWAQALFELAAEKNALERVERDVEFLAAELAAPHVAEHLFDARVPREVKRGRLERLKPHLHPLSYNFLCLLHDRGRLEVLRDLGPAFKALALARRGAVEGVVETARPLGAGELDSLSRALSRRLGKQARLETRLAPELLAGVRVWIDNKLLDQSASGRLERLRTKLLGARIG
jgi:F-type H+-transporting ATPase subunit delta